VKNLYRQYGLNSRVDDRVKIENAIAYSSHPDKATGEFVLLHDGRKAIYDRAHQNLQLIGIVRAELGLINTAHWGGAYQDFTPNIQRTQRSSYTETAHRHNNPPESNKLGGVIAVVIISLILIWVFSNDGFTPPRKAAETR